MYGDGFVDWMEKKLMGFPLDLRWIAGACFALAACRGGSSSGSQAGAASSAEEGSAGQPRHPPRRILSQNRYWAKPGKAEEVYQWRLHATDVQVQMGLPRGRVFRGVGGEEPDVLWQIELTEEQTGDFSRIQREKMAIFQPVMDHMSTLISRFESSAYAQLEHREDVKPETAKTR
jgi:hypothetical protein